MRHEQHHGFQNNDLESNRSVTAVPVGRSDDERVIERPNQGRQHPELFADARRRQAALAERDNDTPRVLS